METESRADSFQALRKAWRVHQKSAALPTEADIAIGVTASFTTDPLTPFLGARALTMGYRAPQIMLADFNQVVQSCVDHRRAFSLCPPHVIVVLWRIDDLGEVSDAGNVLDACATILHAVEQLRVAFSGPIILATPPRPRSWTEGLLEAFRPSNMDAVWRETAQGVADLTRRLPRVYSLDLQSIIAQLGEVAALDIRKWFLYRQPYSEAFYDRLAQHLIRILRARKSEAKKCLVLDCDNTLWGGVVGEDGVGGLALGHDFPGNAFREFQRQIKALKESGIFIALNSKNDPEDVWNVFDTHGGMVLSRSDISIARLNWQSKSENLKAIAAELNIGLDALVFIDDNPFEIAEVEHGSPGVTGLQVPEELALLPRLLIDNAPLFDRLELTKVDLKRVNMLQQEMERRQHLQGVTSADFLYGLGLQVYAYEPIEADLVRVAQLANKTNQFNVTTKRYNVEDILAFKESSHCRVVCISVVDKFGEYGLVGLGITKHRGECAEIDTLLMSCRVIGRGVERALIAVLAEAARANGAKMLRGVYVPTRKNELVSDLFQRHGFQAAAIMPSQKPVPGATVWEIDIATTVPSVPKHVRLHRSRPK